MGGLLPPGERGSGVLVAFYVVLASVLLLVGERLPQAALRGAGATLFAPFDRLILAVDRFAAAWGEVRGLHARLTVLELENARLRGLAQENRRLRQELGLPGFRNPSLRPVEVLALSGDPLAVAATLSVGSRAGAREGDVVLTSEGLVGRVSEVYPFASRAALLTDPGLSVACELESTGVQGILRFAHSPRPTLHLTSVPFADTVRVGQRVLTSGLSRRFPRGIPVGRVSRVDPGAGGLTQVIVVAPAARLTRLRYVFVIPGPANGEVR